MQERISEYVATLKVKNISDYETPAQVCASYFDGRGIDTPTDSDWEAFKEYYRAEYRSKKGKDISETTLQQNYVARGKAFYRWCYEQDNPQASAPPLGDEAIQPELFDDDREEVRPKEAERLPVKQSSSAEEGEKPVRVNFLLSKEHHEALMSLVYLKDMTLTAILTEAIEGYIQEYSEEIEVLRDTRRRLRSK